MSVQGIDDALRRFTSNATGLAAEAMTVRQLKGDASNRSYYRVGSEPSFVVMVMPADAKNSEEKTRGERPAELPFVNVHRYLSSLGVRVPKSSATTSPPASCSSRTWAT